MSSPSPRSARLAKVKEWFRSVVWGIVVGLIVTFLQVWAGQTNPLQLLRPSLGAFIAVALAFEILQQASVRNRIRSLFRWVLSLSPFEVQVSVRRRRAVRPPPAERGLLDFQRDAERAQMLASKVLVSISKAMDDMSKVNQANGTRITKLTQSGADIDGRLRMANKAAKPLAAHARTMEDLRGQLRQQLVATKDNYKSWLDWLRERPTDRSEFVNWQDQLNGMRDASKAGRAGINAYLQSVRQLRKNNLAQSFNEATEHLAKVLGGMIADIDDFRSFCSREANSVSRLLSSKPDAPEHDHHDS